jgi:acetyl esterase/lipase
MGDSSGGHLASLVALAGEHALFKDGNRGDPHGSASTQVKVAVSVYGVHDLARQWRHDQFSRPRDQIVEKFLGASLIDDRRAYFDASPLSYVSAKNNGTAFLLAWGTEDDVVDHREQGEAFLEALKQAGHYVRSAVVAGAPHFWIGDPLEEPGSHSGFLAPRLLRFLQARL